MGVTIGFLLKIVNIYNIDAWAVVNGWSLMEKDGSQEVLGRCVWVHW